MSTTPDNSLSAPRPALPVRAIIILVMGILAAWLAAGSLGWLGPPLQRTLTWLAMAVTVVAALPRRRRFVASDGLLLGTATTIAVLMTASSLPVVNILAVAVLLAAVAHVRQGSIAQVSSSTALAATALAIFRLACDGSAAAWIFANAVGRIEGAWAGWLTGRPLLIGASFGGLDFLVLMTALTAAWLISKPHPRIGNAAWVMLFIFLAQTTYLVVLAFSQDLVTLLPPKVYPDYVRPGYDGLSHMGVWTWGNAIRSLLPWNLPVLAAVFHAAVAVGMFCLTGWEPMPHDLPGENDMDAAAESKGRNRGLQGGPAIPYYGRVPQTNWRRFGPAVLLIVAVAAMMLSPANPDLKGRRIVAYDDGATDWSNTDPGGVPPGRSPRYGLLPALVESLGAEFHRSANLTDAELQGTDVLIVLAARPAASSAAGGSSAGRSPIPDDVRKQIWTYVSAGGRLIVAGDPETNLGVEENLLNTLLQPTAMSFRDDTANSLTQRWEDNLQAAPCAATASSRPGRSCFSIDRAASIRIAWPAGPLIVGRWAWDELGTDPERPDALPYSPGDHLGDLVLAAQQNVGRGTAVAMSASACLSNDGIPFSYTYIGPLLSALAANNPAPLLWWRQLLGLAAAGTAIMLLARRFEAIRVVAAALALTVAMMACGLFNDASSVVLPSGVKGSARPIAYVDGTHLEGMGRDPWCQDGIGRFTRVLAHNNYLPLVAPDLAPQRLNRAAMLISIAPGKGFSEGEMAAVEQFVSQGGFFLSMAGSPDAEPSRPLLERLQLDIKPSPVPPWVRDRETAPLGPYGLPDERNPDVAFYAAWPVSSGSDGEIWPKDDPIGPVLAGHGKDGGQAWIIGDSAFALNKCFDASSRNAGFWQRQLNTWMGRAADKPQTVEPRDGQ